MNPERTIHDLAAKAGVEIDGPNPWDPQVHNRDLFPRVLAQGSLGLGEAYMDGWWDCEALDEFFRRMTAAELSQVIRVTPKLALLLIKSRIQNRQSKKRAWEVADVHYNLGVDVFEATFDTRLTGSCGYWKDATNLDQAQDAKLDMICRKIGLQRGQRVLDIGCGWGAFMGFAAEKYGAQCVGVTVSSAQAEYGSKRYAHLPVEFQLKDYRDFSGRVDHVVSMGMFEHVGAKNYRTYFRAARRAMDEDGLFVLHTIWGNERTPAIDPWLNKYIFPNGVLPSIGQIGTAVEGLFVVEDVHNFGADYDRTLMAWYDKFQSNRAAIHAGYGERFCRMWDYYLRSCAGGFRSRVISVGQVVLSPRGVPGGWHLARNAR